MDDQLAVGMRSSHLAEQLRRSLISIAAAYLSMGIVHMPYQKRPPVFGVAGVDHAHYRGVRGDANNCRSENVQPSGTVAIGPSSSRYLRSISPSAFSKVDSSYAALPDVRTMQ